MNQTEQDRIADRIYAAMETGNHAQARTLLQEWAETDDLAASRVHSNVVKEYGISL